MTRLFVAVALSDEVRSALTETQRELYDRGVRGRFTPEENMHLTLAFIGDYPDPEPVLDALADVSFRPFELTAEGLGRFDDLWWAGVKDARPLEALARKVRTALARGGIPFDKKRFSPHITLIRRATGKMAGLEPPPVSMRVDEFRLMRSDRGKNGMLYTPLGSFAARIETDYDRGEPIRKESSQ